MAGLAAFCFAPVAPTAAATAPVPSLTPRATHALWTRLVARAKTQPRRPLSAAACRPARVVLYAQTDWLRLATTLAQSASPCAQYYVSLPPYAADKTQARGGGQAAQIRALGPSFHALDEINYTGWSSWVSATGSSWYDAGVTARARMATAGFDVAAGDTWAMNELSSGVRRGDGSARRNALDFLHGLYDGGGSPAKGVVLVNGIGQSTPDLSTYKVNLQYWLQDSAFWSEIAGYTSDWAQESYGDVHSYAVAGATPHARRDALVQYFAHVQALATAAPEAGTAARSLLSQSSLAFGNAAWAWPSAYGWTDVPATAMEDYVSAQVYAARALGAATASLDRFGFAWAPRNTQQLAPADFDAQTGAILARLAAAIRDSATPSADPGSGACAPGWCTAVVDGSSFTTGWRAFSAWSPTSLVFANAPVTATAGAPAGPLTVQLQAAGRPDRALASRTVTLASTSQTGTFAATPDGPWTPTLTLTIPPGASGASFVYEDATPGSPIVLATFDDGSTVAQAVSLTAVAAPAAAAPAPAPPTPTPPAQTPPRAHVASVRARLVSGHVVVRVRVVAGASLPAPAGVRVRIKVHRGASTIADVTQVTGVGGTVSWRSRRAWPQARYVATAAVR